MSGSSGATRAAKAKAKVTTRTAPRRPPPRAAGAAPRDGGKRRANPLLAGGNGAEPGATGGQAQNEPQDESARREAAGDPESTPASDAQPAHQRAVCTVALCPICAFVTALDEVRPELAEHLFVAGREILLAVKALVEARLSEPPADEPPSRAERPRSTSRRRAPAPKRQATSGLERIVVD